MDASSPHGQTPPAAPDGTGPALTAALRTLSFGDPLRWLALGWRDFTRCPGLGLFYGGCFTGMGWALAKVFEHAPAWVLALSAGFLLMGPFLYLEIGRAHV
jgi:hypothetical protein